VRDAFRFIVCVSRAKGYVHSIKTQKEVDQRKEEKMLLGEKDRNAEDRTVKIKSLMPDEYENA